MGCDQCYDNGSKDYQLANTEVSHSTGAEHEESFGQESYEQLVSQGNTQVEINYNTEEETNATFSYGVHKPGEGAEQDGLVKEVNDFEQKEQEANNEFKWETNQEDQHLEDMMRDGEASYDELKPSNFD